MNIALIMPKSTFLELPMVMQPLGLFYLAARLESLGHTTEFFDLNIDPLPEDRYDQIWVSATSPQVAEVKRISIETLDYRAERVLGGASVWANPESCKHLGYDLIVGGESDSPENTQAILDALEEEPYEKHMTVPISRTLDWVLPPVRRWSGKYNSFLTDLYGVKRPCTTMFTSRGCPLECAFCIARGQRVLMADGTYRNIEDIQIGDMVMGLHGGKVSGFRIAPTKVLDTMYKGVKPTITTSAGGNRLCSTPDHKIYVNDGHKTRWKRADSSIAGKTSVRLFPEIEERSTEFKMGWLAGYIAGDGCIHQRNHQTQITITSRDTEMLDILQEWAMEFGCELRRFKHVMGDRIFPTKLDSKYIDGVQCTSGKQSEGFLMDILEDSGSDEYASGWLAGMYDSDGSFDSGHSCRIFQSIKVKPYNCHRIEDYLERLGISYSVDHYHEGMNRYCMNPIVFLTTCRPMMDRKYPDFYYYKSLPMHNIEDVQKSGLQEVYDLTTECHSFIVEGFIVHNCESGRHGVIWDRLTRYEPLDIVEYQIKEAYDLGYRALAYYDDILPLNKHRTVEIMKLHRKYDMIWRCFLRSDIINKQGGYDYLKEMRDGGLVEIFVGVESASNEIKNNITKKTTIEQDTNIVRWCKELGIRCKTSFILGLPGESLETMEETRRWILENRPDRVQVGRLIPFPGTPLFNNIQNYDINMEHNVDDDWFYMGRNDMSHSFVSTSHLTVEEIDTFWHKLNRELEEEGISK